MNDQNHPDCGCRERFARLEPDLDRALQFEREWRMSKTSEPLSALEISQAEERYRKAVVFIGNMPDTKPADLRATKRFMLAMFFRGITGRYRNPTAFEYAVARSIVSRPDAVRTYYSERGIAPGPVLSWARKMKTLYDAMHRVANHDLSGDGNA